MSDYPNLKKRLRIMAELKGEAPKPRKKKKINLEIDTQAVDIKIERPEGGKAEIKVDTEFVDFEKTAEGTKVTVEKGGLMNALFKIIGLGK